MALFLNKVKTFTATPVGTGGVTTLGNVTSGAFTTTQSEIEIPAGMTFFPIIIPGGRKDASLTITSTDIGQYALLKLKQNYIDIEIEGTTVDCATGALTSHKINISRGILSEIGDLTVTAAGDSVVEYTVMFKATGGCDGTDAVVTITNT